MCIGTGQEQTYKLQFLCWIFDGQEPASRNVRHLQLRACIAFFGRLHHSACALVSPTFDPAVISLCWPVQFVAALLRSRPCCVSTPAWCRTRGYHTEHILSNNKYPQRISMHLHRQGLCRADATLTSMLVRVVDEQMWNSMVQSEQASPCGASVFTSRLMGFWHHGGITYL